MFLRPVSQEMRFRRPQWPLLKYRSKGVISWNYRLNHVRMGLETFKSAFWAMAGTLKWPILRHIASDRAGSQKVYNYAVQSPDLGIWDIVLRC